MENLAPFDAQKLKAACQVLADTEKGLSGAEIGYILADCKMLDPNARDTKWRRLFNALAAMQNKHQVGNHLIMFINRALDPVQYARKRADFEWRRSELSVVLAFSGFNVREDGKVVKTPVESTLRGARARVGALRSKFEDRGAHAEVFNYCKEELLEQNYYHAVLEAIKGVGERIRQLSGLTTDGADLINVAFSVKSPIIAINTLSSDIELSEQKGLSNMLVGLFGTVRNPTAHVPKVDWPMTEQDALDIFSIISFIHRKLDGATTPS